VQLVADFKEESGRVIRRFSERLNIIYQELSRNGARPEIYLVAHSEGTVVGLLGLLSAICGKDPVYGKDRPPWLDCVRGLMTIGSPIDKHLALWPELFAELETPAHQPKDPPIVWRNYYDLGDPVGFELPLAREIFNTDPDKKQHGNPWRWFNFPEAHDHGFARSLFPGKAHNDYWTDKAVFGHFIHQVVYQNAPLKRADQEFDEQPDSRWQYKLSSWFLPYVAALALLFFAVYTIYKAVKNCLAGDDREAMETARRIFLNVGGVTALLGGLTATARIPRLAQEWGWRLLGIGVFALGVFGYVNLTFSEERERLGHLLTFTQLGPTWGLIAMAGLIAVLANIFARKYPMLGVKPLLWFGGAGVLAIIADYLYAPGNANPGRGAIWPVVLAGALFLYLWWLTILFFDLIFVWHRYIQTSFAQKRLSEICSTAIRKRRLETQFLTPG
jgi:succinate dehydrogenase hydrophobic anchor subunit